MILRKISSTGEMLPVIGLGTWQSFDVEPTSDLEPLKEVIQAMNNSGAKLIDSSPMYGRSEEVIGMLTSELDQKFFYATKVWKRGKEEGIQQMESSFQKFRQPVIDLMQIHNLVDWKIHLKTLRQWKEEARVRYIGITHYMDSMHQELADIIKSEKVDFVQFNYSIINRHAEKFLLQTAADNGVAVLINRPFGEGSLFDRVKGKSMPEWAKEYKISSWSQLFLKFIIAQPFVTCVIPATANSAHAEDNFNAGVEPWPDDSLKKKMMGLMKSF